MSNETCQLARGEGLAAGLAGEAPTNRFLACAYRMREELTPSEIEGLLYLSDHWCQGYVAGQRRWINAIRNTRFGRF